MQTSELVPKRSIKEEGKELRCNILYGWMTQIGAWFVFLRKIPCQIITFDWRLDLIQFFSWAVEDPHMCKTRKTPHWEMPYVMLDWILKRGRRTNWTTKGVKRSTEPIGPYDRTAPLERPYDPWWSPTHLLSFFYLFNLCYLRIFIRVVLSLFYSNHWFVFNGLY